MTTTICRTAKSLVVLDGTQNQTPSEYIEEKLTGILINIILNIIQQANDHQFSGFASPSPFTAVGVTGSSPPLSPSIRRAVIPIFFAPPAARLEPMHLPLGVLPSLREGGNGVTSPFNDAVLSLFGIGVLLFDLFALGIDPGVGDGDVPVCVEGTARGGSCPDVSGFTADASLVSLLSLRGDTMDVGDVIGDDDDTGGTTTVTGVGIRF